jgi:radical SAM superfamily enzyme YgiQ (UPF0313 family)
MLMDISLVNPNVLRPAVFPVGMEYTAEYLLNQGHHVSILDMNVSDTLDSVQDSDLVLVAVRNLDNGSGPGDFELVKTRAVVDRLKKVYTGEVGVAGTAVNLAPEAVRSYLGVEYALVSKGFGAVQKLLDSVALGIRQPGVVQDYTHYISGHFKRDVIAKDFYIENGESIGIATKFGCAFHCQYCDYPAVDGRRVILRDPKEVIEEIRNLRCQNISRIYFCDAVFNIPVSHASAIFQSMLQEGWDDLEWAAFINPHRSAFTAEFARLIQPFSKKKVIGLGADSLSDTILHEIKKGFTVADIKQAVRICHELDMEVSCSVMFGHPSETVETVKESFRNLEEIGFAYVEVVPRVRIYPQTPISALAVRAGIVAADDPLLHPVFYPVSDEIEALVLELVEKHPECRAW